MSEVVPSGLPETNVETGNLVQDENIGDSSPPGEDSQDTTAEPQPPKAKGVQKRIDELTA